MTATLIWFEDFESYPPGNNTITAPWVNTGPLGPSFPDSQISIAYSHSPTQSLGVAINGGSAEGSGWVQRSIKNGASDLGPAWTVDIWVYMPSGTTVPDPRSPTLPASSYSRPAPADTFPSAWAALAPAPYRQAPRPPWNTFDLTLDTWHHLTWKVTMDASGTSALSIDVRDR